MLQSKPVKHLIEIQYGDLKSAVLKKTIGGGSSAQHQVYLQFHTNGYTYNFEVNNARPNRKNWKCKIQDGVLQTVQIG